jgi:excisionase family DNA binding protein
VNTVSKRQGEITIREASQILGAHRTTIERWVKEAISGNTQQLQTVRIDASRKRNRYYLLLEEIQILAERQPRDFE